MSIWYSFGYDHDKAYDAVNEIRRGEAVTQERIDVIKKSATYSYFYAIEVIRGPFPEGEDAISTDASASYYYALHVLDGPFPLGEKSISRDTTYAINYAINVLGEPFPAGEPWIAISPDTAYKYAVEILEGRFLAGEKAIAKYPELAFLYAKKILKDRFPACEGSIKYFLYMDMHRISMSPKEREMLEIISLEYMYRYNVDNCQSYVLAKYPSYALAYAIMIGGRFPAGEPAMRKSHRIWRRYQEFINDTKRGL